MDDAVKQLARLLRKRDITSQTYVEGLSALAEIPSTPAPREPPTPAQRQREPPPPDPRQRREPPTLAPCQQRMPPTPARASGVSHPHQLCASGVSHSHRPRASGGSQPHRPRVSGLSHPHRPRGSGPPRHRAMCRLLTQLGWTPTSRTSLNKYQVSGPSRPYAGEGPFRPGATCRHPTQLGWTLHRGDPFTNAEQTAHPGPTPDRPIPAPRDVPSPDTAGMDAYIKEILSQMPGEPPIPWRPILAWPFTDLDDRVPHPIRLPAYEPWVEILNDAKDEFEVEGAATVFSTWWAEGEDPLDISDVQITDGMHIRAGRLALDAQMADVRATQLLAALPGGMEFILKLKFLREKAEDDWVLEDKFDPVRAERKKGRGVIKVAWNTSPGVLTGIDSVFYQNAYPVTAVVCDLYPIRDPDPANLAPLRDGDLNCVTQRVVEHFEGALRGQGLTPTRRHKIQEWEERVHETGATVSAVAELEKILKRAIILRDIAGEYIFYSGKCRSRKYRTVELIYHNGHAWSKDPRSPERSTSMRVMSGTPSGKSPRVSH